MIRVPPRPQAMTPDDFADLIRLSGHNQSSAAGRLEVNRRTVVRWLAGTTPINHAAAALIRARLRPKK